MRYHPVAQVLHWLIALGILVLIGLGLAMDHLTLSPARVFGFYRLHKSIGITVLLLVILRILWRITHHAPPLPGGMPRGERLAAQATHGVLYGLQLLMPLSGWALVSASAFGIPTILFGVLHWPDLPGLADNPHKAAIEALLTTLHHWGGWVFAALVVLHAAAALRHHLLLRDDNLLRMLPSLFSRKDV